MIDSWGYTWDVCPKCRMRVSLPFEAVKMIRCANCLTEFRPVQYGRQKDARS